jgi:acetoin utilization deacetylase AcuC-like enzyme
MLLHRNHKIFHVERPERVMSIWVALQKDEALFKQLHLLEAEEATKDELLLCHPEEHIEKVF